MTNKRAVDLLAPGRTFPNPSHTSEEVDEACSMACVSLREADEHRKQVAIEELRRMDGQAVWCVERSRYGLVSVKDDGQWSGVPFFLHTQNGCNFTENIVDRALTIHRL